MTNTPSLLQSVVLRLHGIYDEQILNQMPSNIIHMMLIERIILEPSITMMTINGIVEEQLTSFQ